MAHLFLDIVGGRNDEARAKGSANSRTLLTPIIEIKGDGTWIAGDRPSIADNLLDPIVFYLSLTPDAAELLTTPGMTAWWAAIGADEAFAGSAPASVEPRSPCGDPGARPQWRVPFDMVPDIAPLSAVMTAEGLEDGRGLSASWARPADHWGEVMRPRDAIDRAVSVGSWLVPRQGSAAGTCQPSIRIDVMNRHRGTIDAAGGGIVGVGGAALVGTGNVPLDGKCWDLMSPF